MTRLTITCSVAAAAGLVAIVYARCVLIGAPVESWPSYAHAHGGMRYSPLRQITPDNVSRLAVAWTFHTGDIERGGAGIPRSGFESTPIVIDDNLYVTTPFNRVIALDPHTGQQRWAYDPHIERNADYGDGLINRGAAAWVDSKDRSRRSCRRRLFEATLDGRLV